MTQSVLENQNRHSFIQHCVVDTLPHNVGEGHVCSEIIHIFLKPKYRSAVWIANTVVLECSQLRLARVRYPLTQIK